MHKAVPAFTIQHYISHIYIGNTFQLLIGRSRKLPRPMLPDRDWD